MRRGGRDERQAAFVGKPREDWRLPAPGQGAEDRQHRDDVAVGGERRPGQRADPGRGIRFERCAADAAPAAEVDRARVLLYRVNKMRAKHPKKEVESALVDGEAAGWTVIPTPSGHRWGVMRCGEASRSGCRVSVWSTPRNAGHHAKQIRRFIRRCPHGFDQVRR